MTKKEIIKKTEEFLENLPANTINNIKDYKDFVSLQFEEYVLQNGIEKLASEGGSFDFLYDEEDLYSVNDLKERF